MMSQLRLLLVKMMVLLQPDQIVIQQAPLEQDLVLLEADLAEALHSEADSVEALQEELLEEQEHRLRQLHHLRQKKMVLKNMLRTMKMEMTIIMR